MSKIVAFIGSPRKNSISTKLLHRVVEGAVDSGAEVVTYDLNDPQARGCQGCLYCRRNEGCATKDYLQPMYEDIKSADGIVVSFPIYFGNISGQAKSWLDRMYPMLDGDFSPRYPGKKAVTVFAQSNPDPDFAKGRIDETNMFFKLFGWETDTFLLHGHDAPGAVITDEDLTRAYEAGKELVQ